MHRAEGRRLERAAAYERTLEIALEATGRGGKLMFVGNGGSAGIASHMAIDFSKNGGCRRCAQRRSGADMPGQRLWLRGSFRQATAVSCAAGRCAVCDLELGGVAKHFAGGGSGARDWLPGDHHQRLPADNPLRALGEVNFHVGACEYGIVEVAHTALIHAVVT